jgi:hypothetical protein
VPAFPPPSRTALTLVSGADRRYARELDQFLRSVRRVGAHRTCRVVAYDLGLGAPARARLAADHAWAVWHTADTTGWPPHAAPARGLCGWKPLVIRHAAREFGGRLLWLDAATVLHRQPTRALEALARDGVYTLRGQSSIYEHCHGDVLRRLELDPDLWDEPERVAGVFGLDAEEPAVRALVERWAELALDATLLDPPGPPTHGRLKHKWEQALLTVLLLQARARGELALGDEAVDISTARPVRWLSTRNKVWSWVPRDLDPLVRAYHATWKAADRVLIRARALLRG